MFHSPVVSYLFAVCQAEDAAFAASSNSLAILAGFGAGTASVALYESLGFEGTGWLSAGLALAALASTALTPAGTCCAQPVTPQARPAEGKPASEGVGAALCSKTFVTQAGKNVLRWSCAYAAANGAELCLNRAQPALAHDRRPLVYPRLALAPGTRAWRPARPRCSGDVQRRCAAEMCSGDVQRRCTSEHPRARCVCCACHGCSQPLCPP